MDLQPTKTHCEGDILECLNILQRDTDELKLDASFSSLESPAQPCLQQAGHAFRSNADLITTAGNTTHAGRGGQEADNGQASSQMQANVLFCSSAAGDKSALATLHIPLRH